MNPYIPVVVIIVIGVAIGALMSFISNKLGPKKYSHSKLDPFECGVPTITSAQERMSVKFYMTAILFILFDIETVFLYLWAKTFYSLAWFGVAEVFVFISILIIGYVFILRRGALEWD